jgi:hypothetical protein
MEKRDTAILSANGYDIFNRKEQGRILSARPNTKVLLGMNYDLKKQLSFLTTLTLVKLLGNMPRISQKTKLCRKGDYRFRCL